MRTGNTAALTLACVAAWSLAACNRNAPRPATKPTPRYATAAASVDGAVFIAGGITRTGAGDVTVAAVEAYDPGDRAWTRCSPMPTARSFAAAAALDGRLYVFGGLDTSGRALDTVEAYDPRTDSWSTCPPMEAPLSRLAAVTHGHRTIVVTGGLDARERNATRLRVFLPGDDRIWLNLFPELPSGRHGLGLVDADDRTERMFAIGGYDESGPLATVDCWGVGLVRALDDDGKQLFADHWETDSETGETEFVKLDKDFMGYDWRPTPPLHEARGFHGVARIGRRIYAVGGRCRDIPPTEVLDLDDLEAGWRPAAPLPKDLCRFSLVAWRGHLLAFGGETGFGKSVNTDVLEYDPEADTWSVR